MRDREKAAAYASQWVEWEKVCADLRKAWERFPEGFSMPLVTRGGKENEKSTHWWYSPAGTKKGPRQNDPPGLTGRKNEMKVIKHCTKGE